MTKVQFHLPGQIPQKDIRYVVIVARYEDKWVFCRHAQRKTLEIPGGHREYGETATEAAHRELWEETGASEAKLSSVCGYSVTKNGETSFGELYFALITNFEQLPACSEMAQVQLCDRLPEELTYPDIQPELFSRVQGWLNQQSNAGELWDVYDEHRNLTGRLHRRGEYLKEGDYHLVVHVWVQDSRGEFLITKRAPGKGFPNMWECTGGSALTGDDSLTAALREVREETGLCLDPARGKCVMSERKSDYFRDVWVFRHDFSLENVRLLPGETVDKRCAGPDGISRLFDAGEFVPYDYLDRLWELTSSDIGV